MDRRTEKTRQALLDAAESLFAERGFSGVGSRELVAAAGVNVAAIGYHFGSKRGLYLETVRRAILRPEVQDGWRALSGDGATRLDAARALVAFVRALIEKLLSDPELSACTRLMLREAMQPSDALPDVVECFVRPHEELLVATLRRIAPDLGPSAARLAARSVMGQIFHHHLFRPFFDQLQRGARPGASRIRAIADHVSRFSLRGLGCSESLIERAMRPRSKTRQTDAP